MRFESLKMLFAFAVKHGLYIYQMDVDNAYLNSSLDEIMYMVISPGYSDTSSLIGKVLQLKKGLYGLKQSARLWN